MCECVCVGEYIDTYTDLYIELGTCSCIYVFLFVLPEPHTVLGLNLLHTCLVYCFLMASRFNLISAINYPLRLPESNLFLLSHTHTHTHWFNEGASSGLRAIKIVARKRLDSLVYRIRSIDLCVKHKLLS